MLQDPEQRWTVLLSAHLQAQYEELKTPDMG